MSDLNHPPTSAEQLSWKSHSLFWDYSRSWIGTSQAEGSKILESPSSAEGRRRLGFSVRPRPARSWRASSLDQLWVTRAPRLRWRSRIDLHPFIRASVGSDCNHTSWPHLNQPSLQFAVRCGITRAPRTRGRDQPDSPCSSPSWLCWWFHRLQNHVRDLKMIPGGDDLRPRPSRLGSSVLPSTASVQLWKYGGLFIYFTDCQCSLNTSFGSFRLIFNPQINI